MPFQADLSEVILRASELAFIDDCRRQFLWGRQYATGAPSRGLITGAFGHKGLEIYYRTHCDPRAVVDSYNRETSLIFEKLYQQFPDAFELISNSRQDALDYCHHYMQYDEMHPFLGTVVAVENRLTYPVLNPETKEEHPRLRLSGKVDLVLDQEKGLAIVDHKFFADGTYARLGQLPNTVLVDSQLTTYAYLYWRKTGIVPKKVILNIILKGLPEAPPLLKNGTLSKSHSMKTTGALYRQAVEHHGLEVEDYEDIISFYHGIGYDQYFVRLEASRNRKQLEAFERMVWEKGKVVLAILDDPNQAYPSASVYRCGSCPFIQACVSADDGGDVQIYLDQLPEADPEADL